MQRRTFISLLSFLSFVAISVLVILLANGYTLDRQNNHLYLTGTLVVHSLPTGATVTLEGKDRGSSDTTISSLNPGTYQLKLQKDGYTTWEKSVSIAKKNVTTIEAILVPSNPSLAPITTTEAYKPVLSPDGQKLIYAVRQGTAPGIWLLDLTSQPFNLSRKPSQLLADTDLVHYSAGSLQWSPTSRDILLTLPGEPPAYFQFSVDNPQDVRNVTATVETLRQEWAQEQSTLNKELLADLGKDGQQFADKQDRLVWSPDNLHFFYTEEDGDKVRYMIYSKETKHLGTLLEVDKATYTAVRWYPDSLHLLLLQKKSVDDTTGKVSLIDDDGQNITQAYSGTLIGDTLYSFLNGTRLIILTSFNLPTETYYLYGINLR